MFCAISEFSGIKEDMIISNILSLAKSLNLNCYYKSNDNFFGDYYIVLKKKLKKMTIICDRDEYSVCCRFAGIFSKKLFSKQYEKEGSNVIMNDIEPYIVSYFKKV